MSWIAAAIVFAIPVAFAPGLFFYYDVTPKAAALLAGAAILLLWAAAKPKTALSFMTSRFGRWNATLTFAFALVTLVAAANSPIVSLSRDSLVWFGSNWRRFGAVEQIGAILAAFLIGAAAQSPESSRRLAVLRALSGAGVVAAVYGVAQYFSLDPFLSTASYVVGEGRYQIVRPPGPLGHSDYLAAFLLWPIFAGGALWAVDRRFWRWLGAAAVVIGVAAVLLAGSRGSWLGLAAGAGILLLLRRPRARTIATGLAALAVAASIFYVSPAGARLRARAFWISEDPTGGARILLWRDTLHMSAAEPWRGLAGFGPDSFVAKFPQYESAQLARAYPDFYHESPHNMFLDALNGQGAAGIVLLIVWIGISITAGLRAPPAMRPMAGFLVAGLAAALVAQQFVVFVVPTAFFFYLGLSLLTGLEPGTPWTVSRRLRGIVAVSGVAAAAFLAMTASRLTAADVALVRVRNSLDAGDTRKAVDLWTSAKYRRAAGVTADLYFSRRWAFAAAGARDPVEKLSLGGLAMETARLATTVPEQRQNGFYNLAMLAAAMNDPATVESSLRSAIAAGPRWFKPHWALARLLSAAGRTEEARAEAALALDLDGHRDSEVIATMAEIARSPNPGE